jgi:hypothetical protein
LPTNSPQKKIKRKFTLSFWVANSRHFEELFLKSKGIFCREFPFFLGKINRHF